MNKGIKYTTVKADHSIFILYH